MTQLKAMGYFHVDDSVFVAKARVASKMATASHMEYKLITRTQLKSKVKKPNQKKAVKNRMLNMQEKTLLETIVIGFDLEKGVFSKIFIRNGYIAQIRKSDIEKYNKALQELYDSLTDNTKLVSLDMFEKMVLDVIAQGKTDILQEIKGELTNMPTENHVVYLPIYGVSLCSHDTLLFHDYTFISSSAIDKHLEDRGIDSKRLKENMLNAREVCYVSFEVKGKEKKYIEEYANKVINKLTSAFRFLAFHEKKSAKIEAIKYKIAIDSGFLVNNTDKQNYYVPVGNIPFPYNNFVLDDPNIIPGSDSNKKFWDIFFSESKSEIQNSIMDSLGLLSESIGDLDNPASILLCVAAIESVLKNDQKGDYGKSITAQLAEYAAFIVGNTYEERLEVERQFKNVYDERSKIIHNGASKFKKSICKQAIGLATDIFMGLIVKPDFANINSKKDLKKQIDKMRYS